MDWKRLTGLLLANILAVAATVSSENPTLLFDRAFVVVQDTEESTSVLSNLNLKSGELTAIGDIGYQVTALAFSNPGELFGVDPELDLLVRIDPSQGEGIAVGQLGIDIVDLPGSDLAFDRDDNLWMIASVGNLRGLYSIDHFSGSAEWVGPVEVPYAGALAADGDPLYAANFSLGIIDPADGTVNSIGGEGLWAFQPLWMSFGSGSTLWAVAVCGVCAAPWDVFDLVTVDLEMGAIILHEVGSLWNFTRVSGLAIQPYRRSQKVAPTVVD